MDDTDNKNEAALLGSALLNPQKVLPMLFDAKVSAKWFKDPRCRTVWAGYARLWDERKCSLDGVDELTLADAVRRFDHKEAEEGAPLDIGFIQSLIDDTPTAAHAEYYLGIVRNQYLTRKGRILARAFSTELESGPTAAVQKFQASLVEIMDEACGRSDVSMSDTNDQVVETFKKAHQIRMVEKRMDYCPGLPMPWRVFTANYNGLQPGLHVLAARPSTGKTALVNNLIRYWCETMGLHVGFNSMDMQPRQFAKRLIAEKSRVSLAKAEFGTTSERDLARIEEAKKACKQWPLHVCVKRDLEAFRSWCVMKRMKGQLDIAVVDFMQLMEFDGCYRMGVDDRVSRISGTLKAIGNDLDIPVLALSQLNRACEEDGGREPQLSDLRGSGAIEQDAFTVNFLHTDPRVYDDWQLCPPVHLCPFGATLEARQYTAKQMRPVWCLLKKNQNGRTGRIPMVLFPNYFLFMLGDYNAEPIYETKGNGEKKPSKVNFAPLFGRVMPDWRKDPMEDALKGTNGLVVEYRDGE